MTDPAPDIDGPPVPGSSPFRPVRPLLAVAAGLAAGILLSEACRAPWILLIAAAVIFLALAGLARGRTSPAWPRAAAGAALVMLGLARGETARLRRPDDLALRPLPARNVRLYGIVEDPPIPPPPEARADPLRRPTAVVFDIDAEGMEDSGARRPVTGRARVRAYGFAPRLRPGERVVIDGVPHRPADPTNPGEADYRRTLERAGIGAMVSVTSPESLHCSGGPPAWTLLRRLRTARLVMAERLAGRFEPETAALLQGLLLGARSPLDPAIEEGFRRSGAAHLMAISGLHLGLVGAVVHFALWGLGAGRRLRAVSVLAVLGAYTLLSGAGAPAVRSFVMALGFSGADLVRRRPDAWNALGAAALGILLADPGQAFDPGARLSFLAVAGMLLWTRSFFRFFSIEASPIARLIPAGPVVRLARWTFDGVRANVAVSGAAWLATAPLSVAMFHWHSPVLLAANLLLFPVFAVLLIGGLAWLAATAVAPAAGGFLGAFLVPPAEFLLAATRRLDAFPLAAFNVPDPPVWLPVVYVAGVAAWGRAWARRPTAAGALAAMGLLALLSLPRWLRDPPAAMRLTTLDVGHGLTTVLELPGGGVWIYDAGGRSRADPVRSIVAPFLWSRGITAVDRLFLSHPQIDHVGGVPTLLRLFPVREVWVPEGFEDEAEGRAVTAEARNRGIPVVFARAGLARREGDTAARVLWPPAGLRGAVETNGLSLAVEVRRPEGSLLWTGDLEGIDLGRMTARGGLRPVDVLVAPHHGRDSSRSPRFAAAVRPATVVVSDDGRPWRRRGMSDYSGDGADIRYTHREGSVILDFGFQILD